MEEWKCVVCGKVTNTPHDHTLTELLDAWSDHKDRFVEYMESLVRCGDCKYCEGNETFGICMNTTATFAGESMFMKPVRLTTTCGHGERR
jgi:hypothetical protein